MRTKISTEKSVQTKSQTMFALDIGTRSVIGMLGFMEKEKLVVEHAAVAYHESRAMFDGQIHDIDKVAQVIKQIKDELEFISSEPLSQVTIAAAGRALITVQVEATQETDPLRPISQTQVQQVELEALRLAQEDAHDGVGEDTRYFCVGHSVVHYYMDGVMLTNPLGHQGSRLSVKLIATFLPKMVVDSLYTAVSKADLEVVFMTLEPIAAIEVAVPENARLLNIVLVDVGAGTSDMAITQDGTIIAYGMSSVAGDEITELLAKTEMMDFDGAEALKCRLSSQDKLQYQDIFGVEHHVESSVLLEKLNPAISLVAQEIRANILDQNGRKPSAVFLIGGGSQIPGLSEVISKELDLPLERVAVRSITQIPGLDYRATCHFGPEGVTPIGILKKALRSSQKDFFEVDVNGKKVRLFHTRVLHVKDALAAIQYDPQQLVPRRGESMTVEVQEEKITFYGECGEAAVIYVNEQPGNLETKIQAGDRIHVKPATTGAGKRLTLRDVVPGKWLMVENRKLPLVINITVNKRQAENLDMLLQQGDMIEYAELATFNQVMEYYNIKRPAHQSYTRDGTPVTGDEPAHHMDTILLVPVAEAAVETTVPQEMDKRSVNTTFPLAITLNGEAFSIDTDKHRFIFVDLFEHIDFDRSNVKGKLVLRHNGEPAIYTAPVKTGDEIWIYWD